jgi:hypothetical protein
LTQTIEQAAGTACLQQLVEFGRGELIQLSLRVVGTAMLPCSTSIVSIRALASAMVGFTC